MATGGFPWTISGSGMARPGEDERLDRYLTRGPISDHPERYSYTETLYIKVIWWRLRGHLREPPQKELVARGSTRAGFNALTLEQQRWVWQSEYNVLLRHRNLDLRKDFRAYQRGEPLSKSDLKMKVFLNETSKAVQVGAQFWLLHLGTQWAIRRVYWTLWIRGSQGVETKTFTGTQTQAGAATDAASFYGRSAQNPEQRVEQLVGRELYLREIFNE